MNANNFLLNGYTTGYNRLFSATIAKVCLTGYTPPYMGGVASSHLNTHNHSSHLKNAIFERVPPPVKSVNNGRLLHLKIFPLKFKST